MKTAILFSGTLYNFKFSISSLMKNLVIPNDADVFILTERFNSKRKVPTTTNNVVAENPKEWNKKSLTQFRDESQKISDEDINLIKNTFGDKLKGFVFIDDMPDYLFFLTKKREEMMTTVNEYRKENAKRNMPLPFENDITSPDNGNIKCVIDQYNHVKYCYEMMNRYESENGFEYDYIIRARIDFIVPFEFNISQYYLNQDAQHLYVCGSIRMDIFEWTDEFCWFSNKYIARKLFPNLSKMGLIINRKYNTIHIGQNNDYIFAAETQFSLLLYELNLSVVNVKIYRSAKYSNGGDGFDYMNYMFQRHRIHLHQEYELVCNSPSDIYEHLPTLKEYALKCFHITELGTRYGNSTIAFMSSHPEKFISYDVSWNPRIDYLKLIASDNNVNFNFRLENPTDIEPTDLLFIDTDHHVEQCFLELSLHANKVRKYIIFHDTTTFWEKGQGHESGGGLRYAIEPFMKTHPEWVQIYRAENNNGLLILEKQS